MSRYLKGFSTAAFSDCWSDLAYLTVTSPKRTLLHRLYMSCLDTKLYHASLLPMQCIVSGLCTAYACACNHNHHHKPFCAECACSGGLLLTARPAHSNCPSNGIPAPARTIALGALPCEANLYIRCSRESNSIISAQFVLFLQRSFGEEWSRAHQMPPQVVILTR